MLRLSEETYKLLCEFCESLDDGMMEYYLWETMEFARDASMALGVNFKDEVSYASEGGKLTVGWFQVKGATSP